MTESKGQGGPNERGHPLHGNPSEWTGRVRRMLEEQRDCCRRLDEMSSRQGEVICSGDTDGLLRLLGERQVVIDEIQSINERLEPFRRRWQALMAEAAEADRRYLTECVDEVTSLVERVRERDDRDRVMLEQRRAAASAQMAGIDRGRGAVAAYTSRGRGGPAFQDRSG